MRLHSPRAAGRSAQISGFTLVELPVVSKRKRSAFTLVELLVVIAIIGILVALLLPAIQAAREAARRAQCQNNIRNVALAILNYEDRAGALPPAVDAEPTSGQIWGGSAELDVRFSWVVHILPYLEEQDLADLIDLEKKIPDQATTLIANDNPQEAQPDILLCPSDTALGRLYANLRNTWNLRMGKGNYAAYVSPEHIRSMRVFPGALINENQPLARIVDGTSKTIMLAEVRTRENALDPRGVWAAAWAGGSLLGFDMHNAPPNDLVDNSDKRNSPYSPCLYACLEPGLPPNSAQNWGNVDWVRECPDSGGAGIEGMPCTTQTTSRSSGAARSSHPGGVNATHVDGSVVFILDDIDQFLMARTVSISDGEGEQEGQVSPCPCR
jgi:prepilin-type N-terminal cleavage/methylation domain-containing protein/prepilin-type processing-associated H-X9-DG protein